MNKKRTKSNPLIIILIIILVLVLIFSSLMLIDSIFAPPASDVQTESVSSSKTITRDGVKYYPRQDITVFLMMGIDESGPVKASESYNNTGEADMVSLIVFDEKDKTYDIVALNRDTMLNMPTLGIGGKPAGTSYAQLALSHTYGSGLEDSCENTEKTVSDFFNGLNIDYYVSMNMDAIAILNDAVGGVTVNVTDDFSAVDSSIPKGEVTLKGEQALSFVQTRKDVGDQLNISRMERHKAYMEGFMTSLGNKLKESDTFAIEAYNSVSDYIVTDCSANTFSNVLNKYADYNLDEIVSPEGKNVDTNTYMEFHVDEEKLDELTLRLFYSKK